MPRFTLKTLFLGITLIAVGLGTAMIATNSFRSDGVDGGTAVLLLCLCGQLMGAGLLAPFDRASLGMIVGAMTMLVISVPTLYVISN